MVGATSAIAAAVASVYAARGATLYLLARSESRLDTLVRRFGDRVAGHEAGDFTELEANSGRIDRAVAVLGGLDVAVVAHGVLGDQLATERDPDKAADTLAANLTSTVSIAMALADNVERQSFGTIAVLSSVAADRGRPRNFTYAAAKAGVNVYCEGLRSRLWASGARVVTVKLGPVDTPMTVDHEKNATFSTPDRVARSIVRAIDRKRAVVYVPWFWRPLMSVVRNLPESLFQKIGALSGR